MKKLALSIASLALLATAALAQKIESGPRPGEGMGAFQVVDVTGPAKGSQLCYF